MTMEQKEWALDEFQTSLEAWMERINEVICHIQEVWQELSEMLVLWLEAVGPHLYALAILWRRDMLYERLLKYVRSERLAMWLASNWPERWLLKLEDG